MTLKRERCNHFCVIGSPSGKAAQLAGSLGAKPVFSGPIKAGDAILIGNMQAFDSR
jgi:hypothetical protein